jgi:hypothetical protein
LRLHIESGEVLLALGDVKTALWHFSQHLAGLVARPVPSPDASAGGRGKHGAWFRFHKELCTGCLYLGAALQSITAHDLAVAFLLRSAGACRALAEGYMEDSAANRLKVPALCVSSDCGGLHLAPANGAATSQPSSSSSLELRQRNVAKVQIILEKNPKKGGKESFKVKILLDREACQDVSRARSSQGQMEKSPAASTAAVGGAQAKQQGSADDASGGSESGAGSAMVEKGAGGALLGDASCALAAPEKRVDEVHKSLSKENVRIRSWLACATADLDRLRAGGVASGAGESTELTAVKEEELSGTAAADAAEDKQRNSGTIGNDVSGNEEDEEEDWDKELEIEEKVRLVQSNASAAIIACVAISRMLRMARYTSPSLGCWKAWMAVELPGDGLHARGRMDWGAAWEGAECDGVAVSAEEGWSATPCAAAGAAHLPP